MVYSEREERRTFRRKSPTLSRAKLSVRKKCLTGVNFNESCVDQVLNYETNFCPHP